MNSRSLDTPRFEVKGKFIKTVSVRDDWILEIAEPEILIAQIKAKRINADIFTFAQSVPNTNPKYAYYMEWDNVAAIPITTFSEWFEKGIHQNARNKIRKAEKKGVKICTVNFDDYLIAGLTEIFNEAPVRRGRRFSYFGFDSEAIRMGWAKDLERSEFIVAYYEREIIGFIKLLYGPVCARTSGTIAKLSHRDKAPMNALVAAAVERCAAKHCAYLVYGKFTYGNKGQDSLSKFKSYNGFKEIRIPRYFIPLSNLGKLVIKLNLQNGVAKLLPARLLKFSLQIRARAYDKA